tara:strand:- start:326 stop:526 length:201 start_codon:yes stop_codon:yes gene_type:complete
MGWFFEDRAERLSDAQLRNRIKCRKKKQKIKKKIRSITKNLDDLLFWFTMGMIIIGAISFLMLSNI